MFSFQLKHETCSSLSTSRSLTKWRQSFHEKTFYCLHFGSTLSWRCLANDKGHGSSGNVCLGNWTVKALPMFLSNAPAHGAGGESSDKGRGDSCWWWWWWWRMLFLLMHMQQPRHAGKWWLFSETTAPSTLVSCDWQSLVSVLTWEVRSSSCKVWRSPYSQ